MELTREVLEGVVNQFALSILKSQGIRCTPSDFKFMLEDNMINNAMIKAGNPVIIHIRMKDLADALIEKGHKLYDFKHQIESCLVMVPRMLHTLALVPVADIIKYDAEIKKWRKHLGLDTEILPKLLPDTEIMYDIKLVVTATHIKTDTRIVTSSRVLDMIKLRRAAREILSAEVNATEIEK